MKKIKISEYAAMEGVTVRTVKRRIKAGTLKGHKTATGYWYIPIEDETVQRYNNTVTYARVSSSEDKNNLKSQSQRLQDFCAAKGWKVIDNIQEVGSGLNDERKKLIKILSDPKVTRIVVEHKDRLTRFGFNYIETLWGGEIVVINTVQDEEQDLMQDFVSLVTSFCARLYGNRRTKRKTEQLIKELSK